MKKIIGIILIVVGIISTSIGAVTLLLFNVKSNVASSVAIIGGADGPTSIFIAGKIGAPEKTRPLDSDFQCDWGDEFGR